MVSVFRALKSRWYLSLAICAVALGLNHYLKDTSNFSSYANSVYNFISRSDSASRAYVKVVKISDRIERRGGRGYATINVTVENISKKIVTELSGSMQYMAGKRQSATIQYKGKISPGCQEKITVYVQLPRSGGWFGRFKVNFTKVKVQ